MSQAENLSGLETRSLDSEDSVTNSCEDLLNNETSYTGSRRFAVNVLFSSQNPGNNSTNEPIRPNEEYERTRRNIRMRLYNNRNVIDRGFYDLLGEEVILGEGREEYYENRVRADTKNDKPTVNSTLKDFNKPKSKLNVIDKNLKNSCIKSAIKLLFSGIYATVIFIAKLSVSSKRSEMLTGIWNSMLLLFWNESELISNVIKERDKERTTIDVLIPYTIPLASYSLSKRLLHYEFYTYDMFIVFKLLDSQLSSRRLVFYKMTPIFYIIVPMYFFLRNFSLNTILEAFKTTFLPNFGNIYSISDFFVNLIFLGISEFVMNIKAFFEVCRTPVESHELEYIFLFMVMCFHLYIQSLDIFKLEGYFLRRHIHILFSPTSFIIYIYIYIAISVIMLYALIMVLFRCYYLIIPLVTAIGTIVSLSFHLRDFLSFMLFFLLAFANLKYYKRIDSLFGVPFFENTEGINIILLSYRVSMSCYKGIFRLASLVRLAGLLFIWHIICVYRLSKYNNGG